jgi:hypothetical protein
MRVIRRPGAVKAGPIGPNQDHGSPMRGSPTRGSWCPAAQYPHRDTSATTAKASSDSPWRTDLLPSPRAQSPRQLRGKPAVAGFARSRRELARGGGRRVVLRTATRQKGNREDSMTRFGQAYRAKPAPAGFPNFAVGSAARGRTYSRTPGVLQLRIHIGTPPQRQPKPSAVLYGICGQPKRLPHRPTPLLCLLRLLWFLPPPGARDFGVAHRQVSRCHRPRRR